MSDAFWKPCVYGNGLLCSTICRSALPVPDSVPAISVRPPGRTGFGVAAERQAQRLALGRERAVRASAHAARVAGDEPVVVGRGRRQAADVGGHGHAAVALAHAGGRGRRLRAVHARGAVLERVRRLELVRVHAARERDGVLGLVGGRTRRDGRARPALPSPPPGRAGLRRSTRSRCRFLHGSCGASCSPSDRWNRFSAPSQHGIAEKARCCYACTEISTIPHSAAATPPACRPLTRSPPA